MPPQARIGDLAQAAADAHGCPSCPHPVAGPAIQGSANVLVNGLGAVRLGDAGVHAGCCDKNAWRAKSGSRSVLINGRRAHRLSDWVKHCGGLGHTVVGSDNVLVGDHEPPLAEPAPSTSDVPHQRELLLSLRDALGRALLDVEILVHCPHRPRRKLRGSGELKLSGLCSESEVEICHVVEELRFGGSAASRR